MDRTCANCGNFDQDDTEMTVCRLHRKYASAEWTCGDHVPAFDGGDAHAEAQKPTD